MRLIKICLLLIGVGLFFPASSFSNMQTKVIGGQAAQQKDWPWIVGLKNSPSSDKPFCTASLINKRYILTAAHCLENRAWFIAVIGKTNLSNQKGVVIREVGVNGSSYFFAPGRKILDPYNWAGDLVLIRLEKPVKNIQPISITNTLPSIGAVLRGAGFGYTNPGGPTTTNRLQTTSLSLMGSGSACFKKGSPLSLSTFQSLICLNTKINTSLCSGDSGSPVVYRGRLVGVASFISSSKCPTDGTLITYHSNLLRYKNWINSVIKKGFEPVKIIESGLFQSRSDNTLKLLIQTNQPIIKAEVVFKNKVCLNNSFLDGGEGDFAKCVFKLVHGTGLKDDIHSQANLVSTKPFIPEQVDQNCFQGQMKITAKVLKNKTSPITKSFSFCFK